MKFKVYFQKSEPYGWNPIAIFDKILNKLIKLYPEHEFEFIDHVSLRDPNAHIQPSNQYSALFLKIENPENNKYFLISYWDLARNIFEKEICSGFKTENLVELFTSTGIVKDKIDCYELCDPPIKYTPISYCHTILRAENVIEKLNNKKVFKFNPEIPKFRGFCENGFRKYLLSHNKFNVINTYSRVERLTIDDYLAEINNHQINLSFNGLGEISHRDIDILGLGNVLLRCKLLVKFHNDLIPEYHYASVDVPDQSDFKTLSEAFLEKYHKIKKDKDYLEFISSNGKKWYAENGASDKNAEIVCKQLILQKLC